MKFEYTRMYKISTQAIRSQNHSGDQIYLYYFSWNSRQHDKEARRGIHGTFKRTLYLNR